MNAKKLFKAMEPFLPNWGEKYGTVVRAPTVCGVPDQWHRDPRFSAKQYMDSEGNITLQMMVGNGGHPGWVMQEYTPEQCVQIVAAILSRPAMAHVVGPLFDAINSILPKPTPPERAKALEEAEREISMDYAIRKVMLLADDRGLVKVSEIHNALSASPTEVAEATQPGPHLECKPAA